MYLGSERRTVAEDRYPGLSGLGFSFAELFGLKQKDRPAPVDYARTAMKDQAEGTPYLDQVDAALIDVAASVAEQTEASVGVAATPAVLGVVARAKAIVGAVAQRSAAIREQLLNPSSTTPTWASAQQARSLLDYAIPTLDKTKADLSAGLDQARGQAEAQRAAAEQARAAAEAAAAQQAAARAEADARAAAANQRVDAAVQQSRTLSMGGNFDGAAVALQSPDVVAAAQQVGRVGDLMAAVSETTSARQRAQAAEKAEQQQMTACLARGGSWNGRWCEAAVAVATTPAAQGESIQSSIARWTAAFQNQARIRASLAAPLATSVPGVGPVAAPVAGYDFNPAAGSGDDDGGWS